MKKSPITRMMAVVLTFLLVCTSVLAVPGTAEAAAKAKKITLSSTKQTVYVGKSFTLKVKSVTPKNASKAVTYKSSNTKVATVNSKGKVTGKKVGKATITVTSKSNKKVKAKCTVTVKQQVKTITVTNAVNKKVAVRKGKTLTLKTSVLPNNASSKKLKFTSSKKKIATVSSKGKIKGKKYGKTKVTIKAADGAGAKTVVTVIVPKVVVQSVKLNVTKKSLDVNKTVTLKATIAPKNATVKDITYKSSNTKVATVNAAGKVTAVAPGTATITVTTLDGSKKATCKITVNPIKVTSVTVNPTAKTVETGATFKVTATVAPANASNKAVKWSSNNSAIATVDAQGNVKAVAAGKAVITATAADGSGKAASCTVTVTKKPDPVVKVTSVTVTPDKATLKIGETSQLQATVAPGNASNKTVTWSSNNASVATVDATGKVTAVSAGTATITATAADGSGKTGSCTITVTESDVKVTSVTVTPDKATLQIGDSSQLQATVAPENASNKAVTWSSNNTSVATVDATGKVTAVSAGTATITATAADGSGKTGSCAITVTSVEATAVVLDQTELSLKANGEAILTATVTPANAETTITWTTGNKAVATVDTTGKVTAVAAGTTIITATTDNGLKATCEVTVVEKENALTEDAGNYIYTLDKSAVTYDAIRGGITRSLSVEAVAADEAWFAQKATSMEWNNATLKNNWQSITTDTLMRISEIAQELFLDQKLEITASSDTTLNIRVTKASGVQNVLVEREENRLGKSSLTITNQSTGKKVYVKEITVTDAGNSVRIAAKVSGDVLENEMDIKVDFTKDGKSVSLKKIAGGIEVPVITYESTEDAYVCQISKAYYGELLDKFANSSVMEDFVNTTQVFNVYTE